MTHRNDDKLAALQALLSISGGDINDLERAWLISEVSQYGNPNDMWMQVFLANGATSQQFNDAAYEFLGAMGYGGALPGRWARYWLNGGGTGGPTSWEYATLAAAESSGDAWQDGDEILITGKATFIYLDSLAVNSYSGLIHKYPYDGTGTLGTLSSGILADATVQGSDPDTWGWTASGTGTKGVNYDFDTSGGRSRARAITTSDICTQALTDLTASDLETFFILDDLSTVKTGSDSSAANNARNILHAAVDSSNYVQIILQWRSPLDDTYWRVLHTNPATFTQTSQPLGSEARAWLYVKNGRWAVWFDDAGTPDVSGSVPRPVAGAPVTRAAFQAQAGTSSTNNMNRTSQLVTGSMVTA